MIAVIAQEATGGYRNRTFEQLRARHAWEAVRNVKQSGSEEKKKEYVQNVRKLPARILTSGLGQVLAFLEAKKEAEPLRRQLSDWIKSALPPQGNAETDLLKRIVNGDSVFLRRATDEVLAYLQWLNRFVDAEELVPKQRRTK